MQNPISVMLVDDDETDVIIARSIIETTGLANKISSFFSGRKALHFLEEHAQLPESLPDLIFLDINMPLMNGFSFLSELEILQPKLAKIPIVSVLSGFEKTQEAAKISNPFSLIRYLNKPLKPEVFKEMVKDLERVKAKVA